VKLTGERPVAGATPDSLLALHAAGYREVVKRLGDGVVLDIGCGLGDETRALNAPGRVVVGVDYDRETALEARRRFHTEPSVTDAPAIGAAGPLLFGAMDGARLGVRPGGVEAVCSSHIIEHFTAPERHVAEIARVLSPGGIAFVITPNAPADFENPFHVFLFEPDQLASLLRLFFEEVEILGLEGDDAFHADFAVRRASGERLLRLDPLDLRHKVPRSWYVWTYERALPLVYRLLGRDRSGVGSGITDGNLFVTTQVTPSTPVLFAVARRPRGRRPR
jgi:SAM-dependent methyltransferase